MREAVPRLLWHAWEGKRHYRRNGTDARHRLLVADLKVCIIINFQQITCSKPAAPLSSIPSSMPDTICSTCSICSSTVGSRSISSLRLSESTLFDAVRPPILSNIPGQGACRCQTWPARSCWPFFVWLNNTNRLSSKHQRPLTFSIIQLASMIRVYVGVFSPLE